MAREVLAQVLARVGADMSATETMQLQRLLAGVKRAGKWPVSTSQETVSRSDCVNGLEVTPSSVRAGESSKRVSRS